MRNNVYLVWRSESGQDLSEYSLLLALIGLVVIVAVQLLTPAISSAFNSTAGAFNSAS